MRTRLTTGLLSCLMMSIFVGCAASPEGLIRGQSPAAPNVYSGHAFGANTQAAPFPFNTFVGKSLQNDVRMHVDSYYGTSTGHPSGYTAGYPAGYPVSYTGANGGHGYYGDSTCDNGYCQDPSCHGHHCDKNCLFGCYKHNNCDDFCHHCKGHGCPHCKGTGKVNGGNWAPTHLYQHMYKIPQGMVYPQNPTPGALTVYPYYTHKAPDDFFYPSLK